MDDLFGHAPFAKIVASTFSDRTRNRLWASMSGGDYGSMVDHYYGGAIRLQVMIEVSGN
jgi:hypothetical protein